MYVFSPFLYRKILLLFILLLFAGNSNAQFGLRVDYLHQDNYLNDYFKPGVMTQLTWMPDNPSNERVMGVLGLGFSKLKPITAVIPEYYIITNPDSTETIVPDDRAWKKTWQLYFYGDMNFRCFRIKKLSLFAGPGINVGLGRLNYDRMSRTPVETENGFVGYFGLRLNLSLEYSLPEHFKIAITATKNFLKGTESVFYSSTAIGLGVYYTIKN